MKNASSPSGSDLINGNSLDNITNSDTLNPTELNDDFTQRDLHNKDETDFKMELTSSKPDTSTSKEIELVKEEEILLTTKAVHFGKPLLWPQILATFAAASLHLHFGVVLAYSAVVIPILSNSTNSEIFLHKDQISLFSSVPTLGIILGAFFSGFVISKVGQRVAILLIVPVGAAGWILLASTTSYPLLIISRILVGSLIGLGESSLNSFLVEIIHTSMRTRLMPILDVFRPMGFFYVTALGSSSLHWQTVGLVSGLSTLVLPYLIYMWLPNSPRWLATHGRKEDSWTSLKFYRGNTYNVEKEVEDIFRQLAHTPNSGKISEQVKLFKNRKLCRRFFILALLMLLLQLTGNIVTVAYSITIYEAANTSINGYLSATISCVARIVGPLTYLGISNRFKRKSIILPMLIISGISMGCLGLYFYLIQFYDMSNFSWIPLPVMMIYMYSVTIFTSSCIIIRSELLPTAIRAIGTGIHYVLFATAMFLAIFSFPYMIDSLGYPWTFWMYTIDITLLGLLVYFLIPETKGKTLEEIADSL